MYPVVPGTGDAGITVNLGATSLRHLGPFRLHRRLAALSSGFSTLDTARCSGARASAAAICSAASRGHGRDGPGGRGHTTRGSVLNSSTQRATSSQPTGVAASARTTRSAAISTNGLLAENSPMPIRSAALRVGRRVCKQFLRSWRRLGASVVPTLATSPREAPATSWAWGGASSTAAPPPPPSPTPPVSFRLGRWRGQCGINWNGLALVGDAFTNVVACPISSTTMVG